MTDSEKTTESNDRFGWEADNIVITRRGSQSKDKNETDAPKK